MNLEMEVQSPTRPLTSLKRKLTIKEQSPASRVLERELRNSSGVHKRAVNTPSLAETEEGKKMVADLLKQLSLEVQRRQKVEDELKEWKQRVVWKEMEFRQIIARYETDKVYRLYYSGSSATPRSRPSTPKSRPSWRRPTSRPRSGSKASSRRT